MTVDPDQSTWVAQVDLAEAYELRPVLGPRSVEHRVARIWARIGGEPLGYVEVDVVDGQLDEEAARAAVLDGLRASIAAAAPLVDLVDFGGRWPFEGLGMPLPGGDQDDLPISVIIATKNRPMLLRAMLESLTALRYSNFEVCIVDGTLDGTGETSFREAVGRDERFFYVAEPAPGLSRARNRGLAETRHAYVAFADDDCLVDPDWLSGIARGFRRDRSIGCVTGMVPAAALATASQRFFERRVSWSHQLQPIRFQLARQPGDSILHPFQVGIYGTGANFGLRRDVAVALGGFSQLLGAGSPCRGGGEDADMFVRVLRRGWDLAYEPGAIVWHIGRSSDEELAAQLREYGRGILVTGLKWIADSETRMDVLRRIPHAVAHYARLLWRGGHGGNGEERGPMIWAEVRGVPTGFAAFGRGYISWRYDQARGVPLDLRGRPAATLSYDAV
jgi:GT2 family glycosyltransferase